MRCIKKMYKINERFHGVMLLLLNMYMGFLILLAFYPVNLRFYHFSLKSYLISASIMLIFGEICWLLCKSTFFKKNQNSLFLKHQKVKVKVSILVAWLLIVGITFVLTNNFFIGIYVGTIPSLEFYFGFYILTVYLELVESRKNKMFFKI